MSEGPATDRRNEAVIDPTANVAALVLAETKRQDDLRELDSKWRDLMDTMRAQHTRDMRQAESDRIDAIRAVDVGNVQRAAEVQATQALALANQVVATATALETKLGATVAPLQTRIDDLTRVQYEGVGGKVQAGELREQAGEQRAKGMTTGMWIAVAISAVGVISAGFLAVAAIIVTYLLTL